MENSHDAVVFDIPALLGMNIAEVASTLGRPSQNLSNHCRGNMCLWDKGDDTLLVTYQTQDDAVSGFTLGVRPGEVNTERDILLARGNLHEDHSNYRVRVTELMHYPGRPVAVTVVPNEADFDNNTVL
jgi:hypothetical protein